MSYWIHSSASHRFQESIPGSPREEGWSFVEGEVHPSTSLITLTVSMGKRNPLLSGQSGAQTGCFGIASHLWDNKYIYSFQGKAWQPVLLGVSPLAETLWTVSCPRAS